MAAMLLKSFSELRGEHGFFLPSFDPVAENDQSDSDDASPAVDRQRSADGSQIDSGINRMAEISVGAGADEFVVLFESDAGTPILSQVPARPESDGDADPGEGDGRNPKGVGPGKNVMTKPADRYFVAVSVTEEQDKANDFQE